MSMTRLVHGIVSLDPPTIRCDDRTFTVTLTAEQIDLIVELLPQPLERELLEEDLSPTLRHEIEHDRVEAERVETEDPWVTDDGREAGR